MFHIYNKFPARERIRKIKKRNDRIFRIRLSSVALSTIMSISPALTYVTYAECGLYDTADTSTIIETMSDTDTELNTETTFLYINLKTSGGSVIIDEGTENQLSVRLTTRAADEDDLEYADENGDVEFIELYDKDDVLISSEPAENNGYTYVYETISDSVITVKAEADEGYELLRYEITADEIAEETDFSEPGMSFTHPVFMDDDKTAYVEFSKTIEPVVGEETEEDFDITVSDDVIGDIEDNIDEIVSKSDTSSEYENEVTDDITVGGTDSADRTESDESSPDADIDESDDETGDKPYDESYDDKAQDKLSDITVRTEDSDDSSKDIQETQDELPDVTTGNEDFDSNSEELPNITVTTDDANKEISGKLEDSDYAIEEKDIELSDDSINEIQDESSDITIGTEDTVDDDYFDLSEENSESSESDYSLDTSIDDYSDNSDDNSENSSLISISVNDGGAIEVYDESGSYISSIGYTDSKESEISVESGETLTFRVIANDDYEIETFTAKEDESGIEVLSNETFVPDDTSIYAAQLIDSSDYYGYNDSYKEESGDDASKVTFSLEITDNTTVDASFASYEDEDIVTEDATDSDETLIDPVIEEYVKNNADAAYTNVDELDIVNAMTVKNMLVDASAIDAEHDNIDSIMLSGEIVKYWLGTLNSTVPVYELSEDSDYFVAYVDTMRRDGQATVTDVQVANNNDNGEVLYGWHYDYATGLIYIPKECFYEDEYIMIGKVQVELMQNIKVNNACEVQSLVETTVVSDEDANDKDISVDVTNVYDSTYTTTIEKNLDSENMTVAVNGIPTELYKYNASTGELTIGMSPSAIQSINVNGDEQSLTKRMAMALGFSKISAYAASDTAAVALNKMDFASTTEISVDFDNLAIGQYHEMAATDGAAMKYVDNNSDVKSDTMGYLSYDVNESKYDAIDNTAQFVINGSKKPSTVFKFLSSDDKNLMVDLSTLDWNGLISFDMLPDGKETGRYSGGMYCGHISSKWGNNISASDDVWQNSKYALGIRILDMSSTASTPYITLAITTQRMNNQNAVGIFRFKAKPDFSLLLNKRLSWASFSSKFSNLRINTTFQIYKDKKCTKAVGDPIVVKASRNASSTTVEVKDLDPGTYYIKETGVCNGCKRNNDVYSFVIKNGKTCRSFTNVETGKTQSFIKNIPFWFTGNLAHKVDADTGEGIEGVIFRVEYWNHSHGYEGATTQCEGTWYLQTDEDGYIAYDKDHLVSDKTLASLFGKDVKNDDIAVIDGNQWGFPRGYIYMYEVYAQGYDFNPEDEYKIILKIPDDSEEEKPYKVNISKLSGNYGTQEIKNKGNGGFSFRKFIYERDNFSNMTPRIRLDTEFSFYTDYNKTTGEVSGLIKTVKVKSDELTTRTLVTGFTPGKYYFKETGRCPGTRQNDYVYSFTIQEGKTTKRFNNETLGTSNLTGAGNIPFRFKGKILTKQTADGQTLAGAVFKVVYATYKHSNSKSEDLYTWYFKSSDDGAVKYDKDHYVEVWTNPKTGKKYVSDDPLTLDLDDGQTEATWALPFGYLYVTEVESPKGYVLDSTEYEVPLRLKDGYKDRNLYVDNLTVTNNETFGKWKVRLQAKKVDSDGNGLKKAIFGVYTDKECTKRLRDENNKEIVLMSGSDGKTNIVTIRDIESSVSKVTYYCKEIQAPDGYVKTEEVFPLTFTKSKYSELYSKGDDSGELKLFGSDGGIVNEKGWTVRVKTKKISSSLQPLAGAVFGVYTDSACKNQIEDDLVSGEDGNTNILHIGVASTKSSITLYCKEKSAPKGYTKSDDVYSLTFKKSNYSSDEPAGQLKSFGPAMGIQNSQINVTPTPTPKPSSSGLSVKKVSSADEEVFALSGYSLEGAEFSITASGYSETVKTGSDGVSNSVALPDNHIETWIPEEYDGEDNLISEGYMKIDPVTTTYTITETKAPKGHKLNSASKTLTVKMPRDADKTFTVEFNDDPIFCSSTFDIEKLGEKGEVIEGVVFKVEFFDSDSADYSKLEKTWYLKSDSTGHVKMDSSHLDSSNTSDSFFTYNSKVVIPIGGYLQITEISAPAEYKVTETPVGTKTAQDADLNFTYDNNKAWYDGYQKCKINIKKYDSDEKTPLSGVSYELKFLSAAVNHTSKRHPDFIRLLEVGGTITRTTDSNGEIYFDNLDQGTYQLTETKTVKGHTLLTDVITVTLPMTMTKTEADSYGNVNFDTAVEDKGYTNKWFFYECTYEVTNNYVFKMPMTGADGVLKFGLIGFGTLAVLGTGLIVYESMDRKQKRRRKRRK